MTSHDAHPTVSRDELVELLAADDTQVRLNAAVRLAYLGDDAGLDELVDGLTNESWSIRFAQVPEALGLLGPACAPKLLPVAAHPGSARVPAARALLLCGEQKDALKAVETALGTEDATERSMALMLAGEIGAAAGPLGELVAAAARECAPTLAASFSALVAVAGDRALPAMLDALQHDSSSVRRAAARGLAALGPSALPATEMLASRLGDALLPLRERLGAAHALTRVAPTGDSVAALLDAMTNGDRWLQIGAMRHLARAAPRCRVPMEALGSWPPWEAQLAHRPPIPMDHAAEAAAVERLGALVEHADHDVRRNSLFALALCHPLAAGVDAVTRATAVDDRLREEALHALAVVDGPLPPFDRTTLAQHPPDFDEAAVASTVETAWAQADGGDLREIGGVPKWQVLQYLVDHHHAMLHGTRIPDIAELAPRSNSATGTRTASQPGIFAVDDAIMAMYFAVMDRPRLSSLSNAIDWTGGPDGRRRPYYHLGAEFIGLADRPFVPATVYILPSDTFRMDGEWTSLVPVRPLARLHIEPDDFPLLEHLWGSDLSGMHAQFGDELPALADAGFWASKRSDRSAHD